MSDIHFHMGHDKTTWLRGCTNNKGADQPVHPHSLIIAFVIGLLEISYLHVVLLRSASEISTFKLVSVTDPAGFNLTLSRSIHMSQFMRYWSMAYGTAKEYASLHIRTVSSIPSQKHLGYLKGTIKTNSTLYVSAKPVTKLRFNPTVCFERRFHVGCHSGNSWLPGANFINEFTTCFCLKNIVRSSYVKNWVSSNYWTLRTSYFLSYI